MTAKLKQIDGEFVVSQGYVNSRQVYVGARAAESGLPPDSTVTVRVGNDFAVEGLFNGRTITRMAKLYSSFAINEGDRITFTISGSEDSPLVTLVLPSSAGAGAPLPTATSRQQPCVFSRQKLKHVHIEAFEPENLFNWEPETETDVFMAFGVLQDATDFRYCCGVSKRLLDELGYVAPTKPDAILIDRRDDSYLMAEWKIRTSDFKLNHKSDDVDVVVAWWDDEPNRAALPPMVLHLRSVAREAAKAKLEKTT